MLTLCVMVVALALEQPWRVAVTRYWTLPAPASVCAIVFPDPALAPVTPLVLPKVQAKVEPVGELLKPINVVPPEHRSAGVAGSTLGREFT